MNIGSDGTGDGQRPMQPLPAKLLAEEAQPSTKCAPLPFGSGDELRRLAPASPGLLQRHPFLPAAVEIGPGWAGLLDGLAIAIGHHVPAADLWPASPVRITRVSVERGRVAIEVGGADLAPATAARVEALSRYTVKLSAVTCQECGREGEMRFGPERLILCAACAE